jgi:hypothetical protein
VGMTFHDAGNRSSSNSWLRCHTGGNIQEVLGVPANPLITKIWLLCGDGIRH